MKRLPLGLWIVVEIILISSAANGNKNAGYVALINIGLLIFSIIKYYYEEVDFQTKPVSRNSYDSIMEEEEDLEQKIRIKLRDLQSETYNDDKINALEYFFKICYAPHRLYCDTYDKLFKKIQDEYGNCYSFETMKKMIKFQYEKAYNDMNKGCEITKKTKEKINKIKLCMDGEDFYDVYKR